MAKDALSAYDWTLVVARQEALWKNFDANVAQKVGSEPLRSKYPELFG